MEHLRIADHTVALRCDDDSLRHQLASRLADLFEPPATHTPNVTGSAAAHEVVISLLDSGDYELSVDGTALARSTDPAIAMDQLVSWCNAQAVSAAPKVVNLHAAGLVHPGTGRGVLIPAPSGSGKSTLSAGLLGKGWGYLSDELVRLRTDDRHLLPFPKPVTLKVGARNLLGSRGVTFAAVGNNQLRWYLRPEELGGHLAPPAPAHVIVLARFDPTAPTTDRPVGVAEAVLDLAVNAQSNLDAEGTQLEALAVLASSTIRRRLVHSDLDDATEIIDRLAWLDAPPATAVERVRVNAVEGAHGPQAASHVVGIQVHDGTVLFHPTSRQVLNLDPLAGIIWQLLDGSRSETQLVDQLAQSFDAPRATVHADVSELLEQLRQLDLLS